MPNINVTQGEWKIISEVLEKMDPQLEIWFFGSRVKGTPKKYSDLDLALMSEKPIGISTLAGIEEQFSESDLPFKVDIVDGNSLQESFKEYIFKNGVRVSAEIRR